MKGIDTCEKPQDWGTFRTQVRLFLDVDYPFISEFVQLMHTLQEAPTARDLSLWADRLGTDRQLFLTFLTDLWKILAAKVRGTGSSIIAHILDTMTSVSTESLRGPAAWFELEREAAGQTNDRKLEVARAVAQPTRVKTWSKVRVASDSTNNTRPTTRPLRA